MRAKNAIKKAKKITLEFDGSKVVFLIFQIKAAMFVIADGVAD